MQRIAFSNLSFGIAVSVIFNLTPVAWAQPSEQEDARQINAVVGAPFSAVGIQDNVRVTPDGNRFIRKITSHRYRDGQGRTRLERELPVGAAVAGSGAAPPSIVTINNKVTGEFDALFPQGKVASVYQPAHVRVVDTPVALPEVFISFDGVRAGPKDPNWSAPVALGEKSIEGIHVLGTQRVYTVTAGRVGNEKPFTITVEQWSSPELGVIVEKTGTASTGGRSHFQLTQIVQAEPDAALFTVPADYRKIVAKTGKGNATGAESPLPNTSTGTSAQ